MPTPLQYRLALDLGTSSLGWTLFKLKSCDIPAKLSPNAIIRAGVRIFSDGRNPKDGSSWAVTRRNARAMRRRRDRLLQRKNRMLNALVDLGFFPNDKQERTVLTRLDPYELRAKGLDKELTGAEFARALFHINQRRGFLSNRKTDKKDNESGALKQAIKELRNNLETENCRTVGEWLAKRHEQGLSVRARLRGKTQKDKAYDFYPDRAMTENEFNQLWTVQSQFNPKLFNHHAKTTLEDILLHQRRLRPVIPGRCTLISEKPRAAIALPTAQRFRILQELNHLAILGSSQQKFTLTLEQRNLLKNLLETKGDLTFKVIQKELDLPGTTQFNLEDLKRDRLQGNRTSKLLSKPEHFDQAWHTFSLEKQDQIVTHLLEEPSEQTLVEWLIARTDVDEQTAEKIANINLPEGYGRLSTSALNRILPKLEDAVIPYSEAVTRSGFNSHSALSYMEATGEIMDCLPYYGDPLRRHVAFEKDNPKNEEEKFGKIANPTVHIGLNQIRAVVNALIKEYGRPTEVVIEVARELKLSRVRKLELEKEQKANQDRNKRLVEEACKVLEREPETLSKSKRRELSQKMQLWVELNPKDVAGRYCSFSGQPISIDKLLSDQVEIEHLLPYSRTLDDSMNNKTVAFRAANRDKGNRTPYEAFGLNQINGYDYAAILERVKTMPPPKQKRFATNAMEVWLKEDQDFLARALNDTAYLSRITKEYLSCICHPNRVNVIPGRMTALIRGKLGLNELLSENMEKNRNDHRHHAIDAMVIGITDKATLKKFAEANSSARQKEMDRLLDTIEPPWPTYREHVQRALNNIVVSHKPDHSYQGAMMEDTAWGPLATRTLIKLSGTNNPTRHGVDEEGNPKQYKGYIGGSNYCMEIWADEKGKWHGDVVSTYDAYQVIRKLGEDAGWKRLRHPTLTQTGKTLVMRLMNKDYVRLEIDGRIKTMFVAKINSSTQFFMAEHNEANVDKRNTDKQNTFSYTSKRPGSLQKAKGRRCTVSPTGRLIDPGFRG